MADEKFNIVIKKLNEEERKFRPEVMNELAYQFKNFKKLEKHVKYIEQGVLLNILKEQNKILSHELKEAINHIYDCC